MENRKEKLGQKLYRDLSKRNTRPVELSTLHRGTLLYPHLGQAS